MLDRENGNLFYSATQIHLLLSEISNFIPCSGDLCSSAGAAATAATAATAAG